MIETTGTYHCGVRAFSARTHYDSALVESTENCDTYFTIESSNVVEAYDEWEPTCPTCGTRNDIYETE